MQFKRFRSINGDEKYVALTTGHTYRIGSEWVDVAEFAWRDCYASGCMSEDMITGNAKSREEAGVVEILNNVAYQKDKIRMVIQGWIDNNKLENFDKHGKPLATKLTEELGFRVTSNLRDEVHFKMVEKNDTSESD